MARTSRFPNGNRWHVIRMGRWTLAELLKYSGVLVMAVLFVWNLAMLSSYVKPGTGHPASMLRAVIDETVKPLVSSSPGRPWFLNPEVYQREVTLAMKINWRMLQSVMLNDDLTACVFLL